MTNLDDEKIDAAKNQLPKEEFGKAYGGDHSEHNDRIRIAYIWLSVQTPIQKASFSAYDINMIMQAWAGCKILSDDTLLAAYMLGLRIRKDSIAISNAVTRPAVSRIKNIDKAFTWFHENEFAHCDYNKIELDILPSEIGTQRVILALKRNQIVTVVQPEQP